MFPNLFCAKFGKFGDFMSKMGTKGWRGGESTRLPPIWPGFRKSWRRLHTCVEFVVGSLICSERFFSLYSGLTLSSKTNISKFQFDQESGRRRTTMWICYLQIVIYLFIYLFKHAHKELSLKHLSQKLYGDHSSALETIYSRTGRYISQTS